MEATLEDTKEEFNDSDTEILREPTIVIEPPTGSRPKSTRSKSGVYPASPAKKKKEIVEFVPCDSERLKLVKLLPPPTNPNRSAMMTIQREMKSMLELQKKEGSIDAGFHFDPVRRTLTLSSVSVVYSQCWANKLARTAQERSNDNLFTWVLELPVESFDQDLPLVK